MRVILDELIAYGSENGVFVECFSPFGSLWMAKIVVVYSLIYV